LITNKDVSIIHQLTQSTAIFLCRPWLITNTVLCIIVHVKNAPQNASNRVLKFSGIVNPYVHMATKNNTLMQQKWPQK